MSRPLVIRCDGPIPWSTNGHARAAEGITLRFERLAELRPRLSEFQLLLDPVERERAERFRQPHDRERFILGHGLLREALAERLQMSATAIRFARGPYGKPRIEGVELRFNFSDTKDAVLIGMGSDSEIGVDLETMDRAVDHAAVSAHYFTPEEHESIARARDGKRRFLELWTRKEAVLKASGVGIMDDLRALRVDAPENSTTIAHEAFISLAAPAYHVRTWSIGERHIASLALPGPVPSVRQLGG